MKLVHIFEDSSQLSHGFSFPLSVALGCTEVCSLEPGLGRGRWGAWNSRGTCVGHAWGSENAALYCALTCIFLPHAGPAPVTHIATSEWQSPICHYVKKVDLVWGGLLGAGSWVGTVC